MTTKDGRQRLGSLSKPRYRNLTQYRNLTDEEFDDVWDQMNQGLRKSAELDKRIQNKIDEFAKDYDINDLKVNDMLTLRALAQAYITLEDYELYSYSLRISDEGLSLDKMLEFEKLSNIMSGLRRDISNMQTDLNITRKVRKGDKEQSVLFEIEKLKEKAREFYEERMSYIYCEKCNMLLATIWIHYPYEKNKMSFVCNRINEDESKCNHVTIVTSKELMDKRGFNKPEVVPESFI